MPRKRKRIFYREPLTETESPSDILSEHLSVVLFHSAFIVSILILAAPVLAFVLGGQIIFGACMFIVLVTCPMTIRMLRDSGKFNSKQAATSFSF